MVPQSRTTFSPRSPKKPVTALNIQQGTASAPRLHPLQELWALEGTEVLGKARGLGYHSRHQEETQMVGRIAHNCCSLQMGPPQPRQCQGCSPALQRMGGADQGPE